MDAKKEVRWSLVIQDYVQQLGPMSSNENDRPNPHSRSLVKPPTITESFEILRDVE